MPDPLGENPYAAAFPQVAHGDEAPAPRRRLSRAMWTAIGLIVLGPLLGFLGTVLGMMRAFGRLAEAEAVDPSGLAADINRALLMIPLGAIIGLIGALWLVLLAWRRRRAGGERPDSGVR